MLLLLFIYFISPHLSTPLLVISPGSLRTTSVPHRIEMSELVTLTNKLKKKDMVMWKDLSEEFSILKWRRGGVLVSSL